MKPEPSLLVIAALASFFMMFHAYADHNWMWAVFAAEAVLSALMLHRSLKKENKPEPEYDTEKEQ